MKFNLRDLFWLILAFAIGAGWLAREYELKRTIAQLGRDKLDATAEAALLRSGLKDLGHKVEVHRDQGQMRLVIEMSP